MFLPKSFAFALMGLNKRIGPSRISYRAMSELFNEEGRHAETLKTQEYLHKDGSINDYRFIYPEFLPDPKPEWRHTIREKLERYDMLQRRKHLDIPEFYVGSIMKVTVADPFSPSKINKFTGICIARGGCGLRAWFTLRNIIGGDGVEIIYEMYNPTVLNIVVIRLEKRLDDHLLYLRDAYPEYSTFPQDMEPEILSEGAPVPINPIKVKLHPRPWTQRWERLYLKGVENVMELITDKMKNQIVERTTPFMKFDLMESYRATIPMEEQEIIFKEIQDVESTVHTEIKRSRTPRTFVKPKKVL